MKKLLLLTLALSLCVAQAMRAENDKDKKKHKHPQEVAAEHQGQPASMHQRQAVKSEADLNGQGRAQKPAANSAHRVPRRA